MWNSINCKQITTYSNFIKTLMGFIWILYPWIDFLTLGLLNVGNYFYDKKW